MKGLPCLLLPNITFQIAISNITLLILIQRTLPTQALLLASLCFPLGLPHRISNQEGRDLAASLWLMALSIEPPVAQQLGSGNGINTGY